MDNPLRIRLSDELWVRRTAIGDVMIYNCPERASELGHPIAVLTPDELNRLLAWHARSAGVIDEVGVDDGLLLAIVLAIVRQARRGEMPDQIAVLALRALMRIAEAEVANEVLRGWVMPQEDNE